MSRRGERLVYLLLVVLIVSFVWRDFFLVLVSIFVLGLVYFNYYQFRGELSSLANLYIFEPGDIRLKFTAGDSQSLALKVDYQGSLPVDLFPVYGSFMSSHLVSGDNLLQYRLDMPLAGEYKSETWVARAIDKYGIIYGSVEVPFMMGFSVYPRVFAVALAALEFIEGSGDLEIGERASPFIGNGLEYSESREYVPGDNPRYIDWSASARLDSLIVKVYNRDQSGGLHILYESGYSDRASGDRLAAGFLEAVLSYAEMGWGIGLTVVEGGEVLYHNMSLRPEEAVLDALRIVNMGDAQVFSPLYRLLDPVPRSKLSEIFEGSLETASGLRRVRDDLASGTFGGLMCVSCLVDDPVSLLELLDLVGYSDVARVVFEPCSPWKSVSGLENAVELFNHYERVNRSFSSIGVEVAVSLDEAHRNLFYSMMPI